MVELLEQIRKCYKTNKKDKALYKKILKAYFRYLTDKFPVKYKSEKADDVAKEKGIPLYKMTWQNQTKWDKKRELFHYEHCNPISELIEDVLETNRKIEDIIKDDYVCWILKTEDEKLNKKGFRSERRKYGGWEECYKKCEIEILDNKEEN